MTRNKTLVEMYKPGEVAACRLEWDYQQWAATVKVWEVSGWTADAKGEFTRPMFGDASTMRDDEPGDLPASMDILIKWDACSHIDFPDGPLHICGAHNWASHVLLLAHIYERAFELMKSEGLRPEEYVKWLLESKYREGP